MKQMGARFAGEWSSSTQAGSGMASGLLRARVFDGGGGRHYAPDPFGSVHGRMAAHRRHHPAARRSALAGGLPEVSANARVPEVNRGMSLEEFKGIFWWEYFHRLLGRAIGFVFFFR